MRAEKGLAAFGKLSRAVESRSKREGNSSKPTPYRKGIARQKGPKYGLEALGSHCSLLSIIPTRNFCDLHFFLVVDWESPSHLHHVAETGPERIQWIGLPWCGSGESG